MNKAEELIACLEGEIAKRDARIAELDAVGVANEKLTQRIKELKAELAAIKAQEPVAWTDGAGAMYSASLMASLNISSGGLTALYAAPVSEAKARVYQCPRCATSMQVDVGAKPAKAQGVVMPDVNAAAKALCKRHAMICGVDADDQWKEYSQDFIADAETVLANARLNAAPAAPAADAGLVEARKANNGLVNDLHVMTNRRRQLVDALTYLRECLDPDDYMGEISMHDFIDDALVAHRAKGVV